MGKIDLSIGIGGAAGQGIATPGDILARLFVRRGLHLNAYNAYQSIIRGGHIFLILRASDARVQSMGDKIDALIPLNQDTMNRHLKHLQVGGACLFDGDKLQPGPANDGVQMCASPVRQLAGASKVPNVQNTIALGALMQMTGVPFEALESGIAAQFGKKGKADTVVTENVTVARAGYDYAAAHFKPFS